MAIRLRFEVLCCASLLMLVATTALIPAQSAAKSTAAAGEFLTVDQVMKIPKYDAHAHVKALGPGQAEKFIAFLAERNFRWLNICTGGMEWVRLQRKVELAKKLHKAYPDRLGWAPSFNLTNWNSPDWEKQALNYLADGFAQGGVACKVWKDIGMVLKDPAGKYVMIDDTRFGPVLEAIARQGRPLVSHLGEPRNCWLPLEAMTTDSDRRYFGNNPQYHGYLHPEVPNYEKQIAARDAVLKKYPQLKMVGCHLGSLEYDVDEVAKRLDQYPHFAVDLAARMVHLQIQPREKVRNFILKYQDRILYATDLELGGNDGDPAADLDQVFARFDGVYRLDAAWLATDQEVEVPRARQGYLSRGLALPAPVLRKIYYENARQWYPGL